MIGLFAGHPRANMERFGADVHSLDCGWTCGGTNALEQATTQRYHSAFAAGIPHENQDEIYMAGLSGLPKPYGADYEKAAYALGVELADMVDWQS